MVDEGYLPKSPFPYWAHFALLPPFRKKDLAKKAVEQSGAKEGNTVLEIGCGPGFFTEELASAVGEKGKVISQDIQEKMLNKLRRRMSKFPVFENIEPLLAISSNMGLKDKSADLIFTVNVFEEIYKEGQVDETVEELGRILKDGGQIFFGEHKVSNEMINTIFRSFKSAGFKSVEPGEKLFYYSLILTLAEKDNKVDAST